MKTFSQILSEVAQPKPEDEIAFKDKHIVQKVDYPIDVEDQFRSRRSKSTKRLADYDGGEDEAVYESRDSVFEVPTAAGGEYDEEESHKKYKSSNKSKMLNKEAKLDPVGKEDDDIDNDGDVDSSDKYLHTRRKAIANAIKKESVEDISEISRELARSYIRKATAIKPDRWIKKTGKDRSAGVELAGKKAYGMGGEVRVSATESVDLDEDNRDNAEKYFDASDRMQKKYKNRLAGIAKASDRLTKEEVDLNEAFKAGAVKLNDGSTIVVKDQDAKLLNQLFKDLNADNKKKMMKVAMTDKDGFNEILGFAREAL